MSEYVEFKYVEVEVRGVTESRDVYVLQRSVLPVPEKPAVCVPAQTSRQCGKSEAFEAALDAVSRAGAPAVVEPLRSLGEKINKREDETVFKEIASPMHQPCEEELETAMFRQSIRGKETE